MSDKLTFIFAAIVLLFTLAGGFGLGWIWKPEPKLIDTSGKIVIVKDSSALIEMRKEYEKLGDENHSLRIDNGVKTLLVRDVVSRNSQLRKSVDSLYALGQEAEYLSMDSVQNIHVNATIPIGGGKDSTFAMEIPVRTELVYFPPPLGYLSLQTSIQDFSIPYFNREYRSAVTTPSDTYGLWAMTGLSVQNYSPGISLGLGITDWYGRGTFSAKEPMWEVGKTWRILW